MATEPVRRGAATMPILRLFPLNTVVFPGQQIPLHIFEERYRQLVHEVMEEGGEFGIALVKEGREVGGGAQPVEVGCSVRIVQVDELPDGRFNIACEGERRFRIVETLDGEPYLRATVEFLPTPDDANGEASQALARDVVDQFSDYLQLVLALQNSWQRSFRFPRAPVRLADHVAAAVDIDPRQKQQILNADRVALRLERLLTNLRTENARLAAQLIVQRRQRFMGLGILN